MTLKPLLAAGAVLAAATGLAGSAQAAASPSKPQTSCFFSRQWQGWRAPDDKTIYLRVGVKDVYRVDLSAGSPLLTWPNARLVNIVRGSDSICSPLDLDLRVSDGMANVPVIAKDIVKLTPEQVAEIPKKFLP